MAIPIPPPILTRLKFSLFIAAAASAGSAAAQVTSYVSGEVGTIGGGQSSTDLYGSGEPGGTELNAHLNAIGIAAGAGTFYDTAGVNTIAEIESVDRDAVDLLDDSWRAAAAGLPCPQGSTHTAEVVSGIFQGSGHSGTITFTASDGSVVTATIDLVDVDGSMAPPTPPAGTLDSTPGGPGIGASSGTLQDGAPVPQSLYNAGSPTVWNEFGFGSGDDNDYQRNGVLFSFDQDISAFGAWFGDLETRSDGNGEEAFFRVLDNGTQVGADQGIATDTSLVNYGVDHGYTNEAFGAAGDVPFSYARVGSLTDFDGGADPGISSSRSNSTGGLGAGNHTTRWVGATSTSVFDQFLVAVGDDDVDSGVGAWLSNLAGFATTVNGGVGSIDAFTGSTEHISFIGPSIVLHVADVIPEPSRVVLLGLGLGVFLVRRRR